MDLETVKRLKIMWTIQMRDLEEGNGATWRDYGVQFYDKSDTVKALRKIRACQEEESLLTFRIVEVGSDNYYSQPTDALEY